MTALACRVAAVVDLTASGWALRLADLAGARPEDITEENLARLVAGAVREDEDLDFKEERYGNADSQRRELAGDIAAMANGRGGLIIIGIRGRWRCSRRAHAGRA